MSESLSDPPTSTPTGPSSTTNYNSGNHTNTTIRDSFNDNSYTHIINGDYHLHEHGLNKSEKQMKHLHRLLEFEGSGNSFDQYEDALGKLSQDSNSDSWLLHRKSYCDWRDGRISSNKFNIIWIHGKPGAGKTVLASIVIRELETRQSPKFVVAYFFCDYKRKETSRQLNVIRSLLHQLLGRVRSPFSQSMRRILEDYSSANALTSEVIIDLLHKVSQEFQRVAFVIDALDECQERRQILQWIKAISKHSRVLVTSRNESDIATVFGSSSIRQKIQIAIEDTQEDIRKWVTKELDIQPPLTKNKALIKEVIKALVDQSDGMFLWVYFVVHDVLKCTSDNEIRSTLMDLPIGITKTFIRSLQKIEQLPNRQRECAKAVLRWVLCTPGIPLKTLVHLVAVEQMGDSWEDDKVAGDGKALVDRCAHLLAITERETVVPAHTSVYDFLTTDLEKFQETIPSLHSYHIRPLDACAAMVMILRKYLRITIQKFRLSSSEVSSVIVIWELAEHSAQSVLELLEIIFDAPRISNQTYSPKAMLEKSGPLCFPNVKTVTFIGCRFIRCKTIFSVIPIDNRPSSGENVWIGATSISQVFPNADVLMFREPFLDDMPYFPSIITYNGGLFPDQGSYGDSDTVVVPGLNLISAAEEHWSVCPSGGTFLNVHNSCIAYESIFFKKI